MRVVGVVAEYNPFHRGHLKQIEEIRAASPGKTALVIVLSSYFTQRGTPALLSPRQRAKIALECGADLVLLLPQIFSSADAEGFARGAIRTLSASGIVKDLCFGSEITDLSLHNECARFLSPESDELKSLIASYLPLYGSPHRARHEALLKLGADPLSLKCLENPNSRLGVEYLAQLRQISEKPKMKVMITKRVGQSEHDFTLQKEQASANAIRHALLHACDHKNKFEISNWSQELRALLPPQLPPPSLAAILKSSAEYGLPMENMLLRAMITRVLSTGGVNELSTYRYFSGGLAERVWDHYRYCDLREGLPVPEDLKSRNFTEGRIRRALLSLLLGMKESEWKDYGNSPAFIHPLGFTADGKYLLKKMKASATLPIVTSLAGLDSVKDKKLHMQLSWERDAGFTWHSFLGNNELDYLAPPLTVKRKGSF